jgi:hypothetical protein
MSEPIIFVSKHRAGDGGTERLRALGTDFAAFVESAEPRAVGLQLFIDDDGNELTYVQVQPDTDAMEEHMRIAGERIGAALQKLNTTEVTVYGTPGPLLGQALRANAEAGVPVTVVPTRLAGFLRGPAG